MATDSAPAAPDQLGQAIVQHVLKLVPEPLRATARCVALLNNVAAKLDDLSRASKGCALASTEFDAGPESAARLAVAVSAYSDAAAGYCDALEEISAWGRQLQAAANEAKGAMAH